MSYIVPIILCRLLKMTITLILSLRDTAVWAGSLSITVTGAAADSLLVITVYLYLSWPDTCI